jgi:hypothetical protein
MAFTKPSSGNSLEQAVKAIIGKNYPELASRGMLNVAIEGTSTTAQIIHDREGSDLNSKELFIWGTSMWGGKRIVSK